MQIRNFHAATPANEFEGTAAADPSDFGNAWSWLEARGRVRLGESLIGIELNASDGDVLHGGSVSVTFLLICDESLDAVRQCLYQGIPVFVRHVQIRMSAAQFLGLFKRFSVTLSPKAALQAQDYAFLSDVKPICCQET